MLKSISFMLLMFCLQTASAVTLLEYLTDAEGKYTGPTVEDQVIAMDTDKNGFADVHEIRAYLEKQHGKSYQQAVLDRWETNATSQSCGTTSYVDEFVVKSGKTATDAVSTVQ